LIVTLRGCRGRFHQHRIVAFAAGIDRQRDAAVGDFVERFFRLNLRQTDHDRLGELVGLTHADRLGGLANLIAMTNNNTVD
jgi:hypothetical protein